MYFLLGYNLLRKQIKVIVLKFISLDVEFCVKVINDVILSFS